MKADYNLFDDSQISEIFWAMRHRPDSLNESLEKPVIGELVGDVVGMDILDLGCGDALFGVELLAAGCRSYLGIDAATQMVQMAEENLAGTSGRVEQARIEDWMIDAIQLDAYHRPVVVIFCA